MNVNWPAFGAYLVMHNAEKSQYPWRECIKNALTYCNSVYILDCNDDDVDMTALQKEFGSTQGVIVKRDADKWDMDDIAIIGKKKQKARQMVREEYCIYLDADEILYFKNYEALIDLVLNNVSADVIALPYVTFFGDPYKIANFKDAENYWRWKIFKNKPHIGHGIHRQAIKYDDNGRVYMDKTQSDGCEIINVNTLEIMPSLMFAPNAYLKAGELYRTVPTDENSKAHVALIFSELISSFPAVCYHYGWVDFERKARNGLQYWTQTKAYKTGVEHSKLFDGLEEDTIAAKIAEWEAIDTIPLLVKDHPDVIKHYIGTQLKPKVLTVSLSSRGPFGVPKWNRMLAEGLEDYDVQRFAFEDHVSTFPKEAQEDHKSVSFMKWLTDNNFDQNSLAIFADGFWGAEYRGVSKVVSVIHGLWSHPLRDKWDDGLLTERRRLANIQLNYYAMAKELGHTLICVSPFIHKLLKDDFGIDSILIPNAVDLDFWDKIRIASVETDRPLILHGITSVNKGSDILKAVENHPLIKDKFDIGSIDEIAAHCNVPKEVVFKAADVAFLPTKWEASSYLLLECLANNLPIAAYRAGILNCTELEHMGDIGVIVDDYDVDAFAKAIVAAYEDRMKYKMGRVFLQKNNMTTKTWNARMSKLIYEVL